MKSSSRREFLKKAALGVAAVPVAALALGRGAVRKAFAAVPLPPGKKAVTEDDPIAKNFKYHTDAGKVDPKQFPQFKAGSTCASCNFYTTQNEGWGACTMIPSGLVASGGWCVLYQKKPEKK